MTSATAPPPPARPTGYLVQGPGHDAWAIRPVGEVFVEYERDLPTTVSGLAGVIWRVSDGLSFDSGVRLARAGGVNTTELRLGLTWGFHVGFPK